MALDQSGFGEQLEMARDARLRLAQDFGQIGDGQFGLGEQRKDAQPRGLGRRPQCRMDQFEWQPVDHLKLPMPEPRHPYPKTYKDMFIR